MPKHLPWFKAKDTWKGTVCSCDDRPPGQRTGSGHSGWVPRPSGVTCWLGGLTPLQARAEGHPQTPSSGASVCQEKGLAAALAKEQGCGTKKAAGALECSGRLPGGVACAESPRVGGLGTPQDLRSRMFWGRWQRSRRRADGGRAAPGVRHDPPHGYKAPWTLAGWAASPGARNWGFR